jgi:glycosyltransferase involved in cell wall biosynthesis
VRLTFVVSSLGCGGVERVTVRLSAGLAGRGHAVTVVTLASESGDFFRLPPGVSRVALGLGAGPPTPWWRLGPTLVRRLARLRRAIDESAPDVVISRAVQTNVQVLAALHRHRCPVIVTEHGDKPARAWRKWMWYRLRRIAYRRAFAVASVSRAIDRHLQWLPCERRTVIYNPFAPVQRALAAPAARPTLVAIGRLVHVKGFDVLLEAFARVAPRFADWQLAIVGDGELREPLERLAGRLALGGRVVFHGAVADPMAILRQAGLFVLPSRHEGFPNALGEAMSCGLPVIAADCPSRPRRPGPGGVRELVRDGVDGWLVPPGDAAALARAMAGLMADPARRAALGARAAEVVERFGLEAILDRWEQLGTLACLERDRGWVRRRELSLPRSAP